VFAHQQTWPAYEQKLMHLLTEASRLTRVAFHQPSDLRGDLELATKKVRRIRWKQKYLVAPRESPIAKPSIMEGRDSALL